MEAHAEELLIALFWGAGLGGSLFLSLLVWAFRRLVAELDGIKIAVNNTNKTLIIIEKDLRGDLSDLDRRVIKIESRCDFEHAH